MGRRLYSWRYRLTSNRSAIATSQKNTRQSLASECKLLLNSKNTSE
ncbi:hypothetical protein COO91_02552 [Nostoc flagelliforme CCNUN1]|uniref:Uncharacterized protein n=1 Tax=Nostoc flagelliforme CCNUN1 TaxID=2038116 RepID=A0A2K8SMH7_9NOSO|nr:hypothetical protein COO91_02552 [Nostoc flagelliforme CCNUN1]